MFFPTIFHSQNMWVSASQCMQPHEAKSSSFTLCISWLSWLFSVEPDIQGYFGKYSQIGLREDDCWFLPFFAWGKTGGSAWEARSRSRGWKLSGRCGLQWQLCVCVWWWWFLMMKLHRRISQHSMGGAPASLGRQQISIQIKHLPASSQSYQTSSSWVWTDLSY